MSPDWRLAGEFFESCNCEILCPCIITGDEGAATHDRCLSPMACRIDDGALDGLALAGLCFVYVIDSPAVMASGDWRVGIYIDERADGDQRAALLSILRGERGGPPEAMSALVGEWLGVKYVPIEFALEGRTRRLRIPGIFDTEVEGQSVPGWERVYEIANVHHPMGDSLPIARTVEGRLEDADFGLSIDNAGRNGHYRRFSWVGD